MRYTHLLFLLLLVTPALVRPEEPPAESLVFRGKTFLGWCNELRDPEPRVRRRAAMALVLGRFGKRAVPPLLEAQRDKDESVRMAALHALARLGPDAPEAGPLLAKAAFFTESIPIPHDLFVRGCSVGGFQVGAAGVPALLERLREEVGDNSPLWRSVLYLDSATF